MNTEPNWDAYLDALEALTDIDVVGITDYFGIEGYRRVCKARSQGRLKNLALVLPNIEFRLNKTILSAGQTRRLNYHVIFSDSVSPDLIDEHFLQELKFECESKPQDPNYSWAVRRANLTELGRKLKAEHTPFQNRSDYEIGCMNATVDPARIKDVLQQKGSLFKGKYLIVLAEENTSLMSWDDQYHLTRKVLLQGADAIFSGNPATASWARAERLPSSDDFISEFKSLKPCIHGSDAHRLEDIGVPDLNRYCWIKADTTFEGLKQILYEPQARVYIGDAPPNLKNSYQTIDSVVLRGNYSWIAETEIPLNQDLVAIIGSRGSGKSALAELIAYAGGAHFFASTGSKEDSFLSKASRKSTANQIPITGAEIMLKWRDGSDDMVAIAQDLRNGRPEEKVKYLPQKFVERLCAPENTAHLEKEIEHVIFQRIPRSERHDAATFDELRSTTTQSVVLKRARVAEAIRRLNQNVAEAQARLGTQSVKQAELERLKKEIERLEKSAPQLQQQNQDDIKELDRLTELQKAVESQLLVLSDKITRVDQLNARLEMMRDDVNRFNSEVSDQLGVLGLSEHDVKFRLQWPDQAAAILEARKKQFIKEVGAARGNPENPTPDTLAAISAQIATVKGRLKLSEAKRKEYEKHLRDKEQIENAIRTHEKELLELKDVVTAQLKQARAQRLAQFETAFELLREEKAILASLYQPLTEALAAANEAAKKLTFVSRITCDRSTHATRGMEILDKRKSQFRDDAELEIKIKKFWDDIETVEFDPTSIRSAIQALQEEFVSRNGEKVAIGTQLRKGYTPKDFADWLFATDWFSVTYSVTFDGKDLNLLSPGEKGIVLLLLYLEADSNDNRPLIIDQPDDNLDNLSVYPTLIEYFRARKVTRQIIIITHNPNLVVNTDAEQVLVANFDGTRTPKLSYRSGALEDSNPLGPILGIREETCKILEGGTKAFQLREQRYALT